MNFCSIKVLRFKVLIQSKLTQNTPNNSQLKKIKTENNHFFQSHCFEMCLVCFKVSRCFFTKFIYLFSCVKNVIL